MPGISEAKQGFWLGIGIFLALFVLGLGQMAIMRAVHRG